jgi:hypothetical protein
MPFASIQYFVFSVFLLLGFLDIKGALIDVSNMVAMLSLFSRLKQFLPILFVGMLLFRKLITEFLFVEFSLITALKGKKLQTLFQGFYEYVCSFLHIRHLTASTFGKDDNEAMLMQSFYVVINPGARTTLTADEAKTDFSGIFLCDFT